MRATAIAGAILAILTLSISPASARCFTSADDHRFPCGGGVDMMGQRMGIEPINPVRAIRHGKGATNVQIVSHPAGCPRSLFCGCGVSVRVFGHSVRTLWPSSAWLKYPSVPRSAASGGMVGWYPGHVAYIEQVHGDGTATVYDPNSGGGQTRIQRVPLDIFHRIVNPRAHAEDDQKPIKLASADGLPVREAALAPVEKEPPVDELAKVRPAADAALFSIYSELPHKTRPVVAVMAALNTIPLGSPREEVIRAASLFKLSDKMMLKFAAIESSLKPTVRTGSYKGLFQLSEFEFRRYGAGGNIYGARENAIAAANKFATETVMYRHAHGRDPTFSDLYLIHQQGWEGADQHVSNPENVAYKNMCRTREGQRKGVGWCKRAIWGNVPYQFKAAIRGGVEALTSSTFVCFWRSKVEGRAPPGCEYIASMKSKYAEVRKAKKKKKKKRGYRYRTKLA